MGQQSDVGPGRDGAAGGEARQGVDGAAGVGGVGGGAAREGDGAVRRQVQVGHPVSVQLGTRAHIAPNSAWRGKINEADSAALLLTASPGPPGQRCLRACLLEAVPQYFLLGTAAATPRAVRVAPHRELYSNR